MRIIAALLLLVASLLSAVLGGGYVLSGRYQREVAEIQEQSRSDSLSAVSADLVSPAELAKMRAAEAKRRKGKPQNTAGRSSVILGVALGGAALLGLISVVLLFLNRARRLCLVAIGLGLAASAFGLATQGLVVLLAIMAGLQLAAGLLAWRAAPRSA